MPNVIWSTSHSQNIDCVHRIPRPFRSRHIAKHLRKQTCLATVIPSGWQDLNLLLESTIHDEKNDTVEDALLITGLVRRNIQILWGSKEHLRLKNPSWLYFFKLIKEYIIYSNFQRFEWHNIKLIRITITNYNSVWITTTSTYKFLSSPQKKKKMAQSSQLRKTKPTNQKNKNKNKSSLYIWFFPFHNFFFPSFLQDELQAFNGYSQFQAFSLQL